MADFSVFFLFSPRWLVTTLESSPSHTSPLSTVAPVLVPPTLPASFPSSEWTVSCSCCLILIIKKLWKKKERKENDNTPRGFLIQRGDEGWDLNCKRSQDQPRGVRIVPESLWQTQNSKLKSRNSKWVDRLLNPCCARVHPNPQPGTKVCRVGPAKISKIGKWWLP